MKTLKSSLSWQWRSAWPSRPSRLECPLHERRFHPAPLAFDDATNNQRTANFITVTDAVSVANGVSR